MKKWTPHLVIIGLLAVLALLYALPALQGKELVQHDNISWKAMSHEADTWHETTGEDVLWSNSMFGGMPTYTYYIGKRTFAFVSYPYNFLINLLPKPANFFILAMLCFYALSRVLKMNRWLGLLGAAAFAFSTYNPIIISVGHETKMFAIALMPLVLAGFILIYRGRLLAGSALFSFAMACQTLTGHYQVEYYTAIILAIAGIAYLIRAVKEGQVAPFLKSSVVAVLAGLVGAATVAVMVLPTKEYNDATMRGGKSELTLNHDKSKAKGGGLDKDYAFLWSNSIGETWTMLVPDLYGGGSGEDAERLPETSEIVGPQYEKLPGYWGPQPFVTGADHYLGAIVCFLAILGFIVVRHPLKWALAAASFVAIVMSWGKHAAGFNYFLFDTLPLLKNFRTPSMVLVIPQFIFPLMAVWGLKVLFENSDSGARWKSVKLAALITGGLAVLLGVGGQMFFDFTNPEADGQYPAQMVSALKSDRAAMAMRSGLLSAFYIAIAAGVLWAFLKEKLKMTAAIGILTALILIDLFTVNKRYLNESNFQDPDEYQAAFQPRAVDQQVMADKDPYFRVFDASRNTYNDAVQAYFFKAVGGYSPAKMEIYQDLIDVHLTPQKGMNAAVLNMLNTKYFIMPGAGAGQEQLIPNTSASGNAWFVDNVKLVNTADEEMLSMEGPKLGDTVQTTGGWDPKQTAIVRNSFVSTLGNSPIGKDPAASVRLTKYGLNDLHFQSNNSREGLAVFSDIYYDKGWKAYIDGKETPIIRANYVLRALRVPAGNHKIDFKFNPASFNQGNMISGITSAIVILLGIAALVFTFRRKEEPATV